MGADHARQRVVVGDGEGPIAQLRRPPRQLIRMGRSLQEGVVRLAVQLGIGAVRPANPFRLSTRAMKAEIGCSKHDDDNTIGTRNHLL
jgi:hypothetical protein